MNKYLTSGNPQAQALRFSGVKIPMEDYRIALRAATSMSSRANNPRAAAAAAESMQKRPNNNETRNHPDLASAAANANKFRRSSTGPNDMAMHAKRASEAAASKKHEAEQAEKIARLELQLLENQRRASAREETLQAELEAALDANRALRTEVEELTADAVETEECRRCSAVVVVTTSLREEDVPSGGRADETSSVKSNKYGRTLREKDDAIRDLEDACARKDRAMAALSTEVQGAREEVCRLKLFEAARLVASAAPSKKKSGVKVREFSSKTTLSGGGGKQLELSSKTGPVSQSGSTFSPTTKALRSRYSAHTTFT